MNKGTAGRILQFCMQSLTAKPVILLLLFILWGDRIFAGPQPINFPLAVKDSSVNPATILQPIFLPQNFGPRIIAKKVERPAIPFSPAGSDLFFYFLCGLFFMVGLSVKLFPKYYTGLYRVFFQSGFRQKAIRDQLVQNRLASLSLNLLFFITGGIFIYLFFGYKGISMEGKWYVRIGLCVLLLMLVYGGKYIALQSGKWLFGTKAEIENYTFIVFFLNKIAGLILLPAVVVLWLGSPSIQPVFAIGTLLLVGCLFLYRYILALPMARKLSNVSSFHFFIYLCGFEILPIILLAKFLINFLESSI
jgi:hypothetical protein